MEEYGPPINYYPGKKNVNADKFSCLPCCNVSPIPVGENDPLVLLDFISMIVTYWSATLIHKSVDFK